MYPQPAASRPSWITVSGQHHVHISEGLHTHWRGCSEALRTRDGGDIQGEATQLGFDWKQFSCKPYLMLNKRWGAETVSVDALVCKPVQMKQPQNYR